MRGWRRRRNHPTVNVKQRRRPPPVQPLNGLIAKASPLLGVQGAEPHGGFRGGEAPQPLLRFTRLPGWAGGALVSLLLSWVGCDREVLP